ncbi:MAG TPA: HAD hydrolase-like protein [Bacillota bacterium]|nr:HAD hydrolase-like protein [Bacillota bacterium]
MSSYKKILFDLDGTLTASEPGIFACLKHALRYFGIEEENEDKLRLMIGPPLGQSFCDMYGFSEQEAAIALEKYRERYTVTGIFENSVYEGIPELLDTLCKKGCDCILATSKPEPFAKRILEHFGIGKYFAYVSAGDMAQKQCEKEDIIRKALAGANVADKSQAVMVGDRKYDIIGAKRCGIDSIGVLYGYGDLKELQEAGATYIAEQVSDIEKIIFGD